MNCCRPCDPLSCLLFTALWLRCGQTIVVHETPSAVPPSRTHAWIGLLILLADRPSLPLDAPSDGLRRVALPASERSRLRQGVLHAQSQRLQRTSGWNGCGPFLSEGLHCIAWNTGALLDMFSPDRGTGNPNSITSKNHNNIICLQEVHGKDEFLQAIQVLAPQFRLFGTFLPNNENAGGSAICIHRDLLPEEAIVTHLITCHGRDHLVNIRSERHSLVIVNVHHFEPELTLRQLRGRLGLIHPH